MINTRDLYQRQAELEKLNEELEGALTPEQLAEWSALCALELQVKGFMGGVTLHSADELEELAKECCEYSADQLRKWPLNCIDWYKAGVEMGNGMQTTVYKDETYYFS